MSLDIVNMALLKFGVRLLRALKTKIFRKCSSLLSNGKTFSSLNRGLDGVFHFLSRIILKISWSYRTEFLILAKEISLFFSVGQVASLIFFNVSHMLSQVKQLSNFELSSLLSATESSWPLSVLTLRFIPSKPRNFGLLLTIIDRLESSNKRMPSHSKSPLINSCHFLINSVTKVLSPKMTQNNQRLKNDRLKRKNVRKNILIHFCNGGKLYNSDNRIARRCAARGNDRN